MTKNTAKSQPPNGRASDTAVLIVAAGSGSRAGGDIPKQYQFLAGRPVLAHTVAQIRRAMPDALIQVVIGENQQALYAAALPDGDTLLPPVIGGDSRQASVLRGLEALAEHTPKWVFVHDAARPFVSAAVIARLRAALEAGADCALPALAVVDTLKKQGAHGALSTVDRSGLFRAQTPQAADFDALWTAHKAHANSEHTDDAALMEAAGHSVSLVTGDPALFKITTPEDFAAAEAHILSALGDIRTATGFDVHRFEAGDHVRLCGVDVPHSAKLKGHSDADVGMHALTDALYSALCAGDIGAHFPPSDDQYRHMDSATFLTHAASMVAARGGVVAHAAVTLICERPKIGPYRDAMRARLAGVLGIGIDRVSVQATTTEKLGFTGRGEGIAAQASVTIRLPLGAAQ